MNALEGQDPSADRAPSTFDMRIAIKRKRQTFSGILAGALSAELPSPSRMRQDSIYCADRQRVKLAS